MQGGNGISFLITTAAVLLILKDDEEPAGGGFPGTDLGDQVQIVLLQHAAVRVCLLIHFLADDIRMLVKVCPLGKNLELDLHGADLQVADKGVDDIPLLTGAAQKKIDGNHFDDLQITVVLGVDNTIFNFGNGQILGSGIPIGRLRFLAGTLLLFGWRICLLDNAAVFQKLENAHHKGGQAFTGKTHQRK